MTVKKQCSRKLSSRLLNRYFIPRLLRAGTFDFFIKDRRMFHDIVTDKNCSHGFKGDIAVIATQLLHVPQ